MRYTIITTTILRESLIETCRSVDEQTCDDWEHLIVVDRPGEVSDLLAKIVHPRRRVIFCDTAHRNYGDTCKRLAHAQAAGDYLLYVDDDDRLARPDALADLLQVTSDWATFPILHHGLRLFSDPPQKNFLGGLNCLFGDMLPSWPDDTGIWGADWTYIERLLRTGHRPQAFPNLAPIAIVEAHHYGR